MSSKDKKVTRARSIIWKYFIKIDNFMARCRTCNQNFSYRTTTSNLKKHLRKRHKEIGDIDSHECLEFFEKDRELEDAGAGTSSAVNESPSAQESKIEFHIDDLQEYIQPKKMKSERRSYGETNRISMREAESLSILQNNSRDNSLYNADDDDEIFGKFLTVELRKLMDQKLKNRCKRDILSILMEYGTAQDDEGNQEETS